MAGMKLADLVTDLKAALNDAATAFTNPDDSDFDRHLNMAALDLGRVRRRTLSGSLSLVAEQAEYPAPPDMVCPKLSVWGVNERASTKPWDASFPGRLPSMTMSGDPGARTIVLLPAPSQSQIILLGSVYRFYYFAGHQIGTLAADTTIRAEDRGLLLLRAQAEAMKELSMRGSKKPVQLRDGMGSAPKNGTPAALFDQLMREFESLSA